MAAAAVLLGAALLLWPALANHYPLAFIDTVAYLLHTLHWRHPWDKTAAYGPLILAFHWRISLWGVAVAQALALSWLLWRVGALVRGRPDPLAHALAGTLANAFMTGALSGPHDRYGARIAWIVVAAAATCWTTGRAGDAGTRGRS